MSIRPTFLLRAYLLASTFGNRPVRRLLERRQARGKEDPVRLNERLGHPVAPRPAGALIWLHGASVGESLALLPLVERLLEARPTLSVLVTTGTVTSARLMVERLPARARHQFVPVDTAAAVVGFLDHWRPDVAVWAESEFWPRLIFETAARDIPMILLNARMTSRSVERWLLVRRTASALLGSFDLALAQDEATAAALARLGMDAGRIRLAGTLKQGAAPPDCDPDALVLFCARDRRSGRLARRLHTSRRGGARSRRPRSGSRGISRRAADPRSAPSRARRRDCRA